MATDEEYARRQEAYEERYEAKREMRRPRPATELHVLRQLAGLAVDGDAAAALDFAVKCTPENLLLALDAERWDRDNPFYLCRECRDGADLPRGYMCQACGEGSGYGESW